MRGAAEMPAAGRLPLLNVFFGTLLLAIVGLACTAAWLSDVILGTDTMVQMVSFRGESDVGTIRARPSVRDFRDNIGETSAEGYLSPEPFDAVYTWVNGSEPQQQRDVELWQSREAADDAVTDASPTPGNHSRRRHHHVATPTAPALPVDQLEQQSSASRFQDHDELLYSLRSLERFAPWVRRVYLVTNGQVPTWLNLSDPRIRVVSHAQLFTNASHLPTFSSPAIESHLHRIPGLSKRFLYLNDDTFFGAPVVPDDFYSPTRGHRIYLSWPVPNCAQGCPSTWLKDGFCDRACNTTDCDWDGGDCLPDAPQLQKKPNPYLTAAGVKTSQQGGQYDTKARVSDGSRDGTMCADNCADQWLGDKHCDVSCDVAACGFDAGDCDANALRTLPTINASASRSKAFRVLWGTKAFLLNVSGWFPAVKQATIESGDFDDQCWVRTASIIQSLRSVVGVAKAGPALAAAMKQRSGAYVCSFTIRGSIHVAGQSAVQTVVHFNVTLEPDTTLTRQHNATAAPSSTAPTPHRQAIARLSAAQDEMMRRNMMIAQAQARVEAEKATTAVPNPVSTRRELQQHEEPIEVAKPASTRSSQPESMEARQLREFNIRMARQKEAEAAADALRESTDWRRALKDAAAALPAGAAVDHAASTQRRLLDMFGDSLKFGTRLLAARFGNAARKVPSHMVHMIDVDVVNRLWDLWPAEFDATSASRFRSKRNMQYGFFHFYYIIHSLRNFTSNEMFDEIVDVNANGVLDGAEARRIALIFFEKGWRQTDLMQRLNESTMEAFAALNESVPEEFVVRNKTTAVAPINFTNVPASREQHLQVNTPAPSNDSALDPLEVERSETATSRHDRRRAMNVDRRAALTNVTLVTAAPSTPVPSPPAVTPPPYTIPPYMPPNPDDKIEPLPEEMVDLVLKFARLAAADGPEGRLRRREAAAGVESAPAPATTAKLNLTRAAFAGSSLFKVLAEKVQANAFKYTFESEDEITFFMVRDNTTVVQHQMDHVLYKRAKFLCVNDNMNHTHPNHTNVVSVLQRHFNAYYDRPSRFERRDGARNEFTRLSEDELRDFYREHPSREWRRVDARTERAARSLRQPRSTVGFTLPAEVGTVDADGGEITDAVAETSVERSRRTVAGALISFGAMLAVVTGFCVALRRRVMRMTPPSP